MWLCLIKILCLGLMLDVLVNFVFDFGYGNILCFVVISCEYVGFFYLMSIYW